MLNLILSGILGYLFGDFIGGKKTGEPGRLHWEWFIKNCKIHLHHWIIMSLNLLIYICFGGDKELIIGFLLGGTIHGLTYSDRFKILVC